MKKSYFKLAKSSQPSYTEISEWVTEEIATRGLHWKKKIVLLNTWI